MADISDLPAPTKQSDISDLPAPPSQALPKPAATIPGAPQPVTPKEPDIFERAGEVGKATGVGALAGAFAPELLTAGGGLASVIFPPAAPFLYGAGAMARGARLAGAATGAIGGLAGETAGQAVEMAGGPKMGAEAARLIGGMAGPETARVIAKPFAAVGGYALSSLVNKVAPGLGTGARALGQILEAQERGAGINLTQAQREFIAQKLASIRGGQPTLQPQIDIYNVLRQAADRTVQEADSQARVLEQEAQRVLAGGESAAAGFLQQAEQRFGRLQSQFENAAQVIREQARLRAETVMQRAAQQGPQIQQAAQQEANAIIAQGREQADRLVAQGQQRVARLQDVAGKLRSTGAQRVEAARGAVGRVGEAKTPTEIGTNIREGFMRVINKLKETREANVERYKGEAFGSAVARERAGERYQSTQAYKKAVEQIDNELKSPETGLANVPSGEIRKELTSVKEALQRGIRTETTDPTTGDVVIKYQPLSFEALEKMRRLLRDRSYGLPASGYDAIGQQQAGRLASSIESIQKEFSPGFEKYLSQYAADSKPLNEFRNRLGKAISDVAEFDMGQFIVDPATLGGQAFRTATTVDQVIKTLGQQDAERLARSFIADKMRGGAAKDVSAALDASRDWIGKFPALQAELQNVARQSGVAESTAARRQTLARALRTEMGRVPTTAGTAARRAETDAELAAAARLKAGETEAARVAATGEKEAAKITGEAETDIGASARAVGRQARKVEESAKAQAEAARKQAETEAKVVTTEAQALRKAGKEKADILLNKTTPAERVRDILLGKNAEEWSAMADAVKAAPGSSDNFSRAVAQVISDRAEQSLPGAIRDWKYISQKLVDNQLMTQREVDKVGKQLEEIFVAPADARTRMTMVQRLVRNALTGYAAPGVVRGAEAAVQAVTE